MPASQPNPFSQRRSTLVPTDVVAILGVAIGFGLILFAANFPQILEAF